MKRLVFRSENTIQVFRIGDTANEKIAEKKEQIVQTYTFSVDQFNYIASGKGNMTEFFSFDKACCLDCPFSTNESTAKAGKLTLGDCYTHKYMQYSGFVSMIKSIIKEFGVVENIPTFDQVNVDEFVKKAEGKYVRFGSYGEPTLHPAGLVHTLVSGAKSYTGYTHQWRKQADKHEFFMASVHTENERKEATAAGYRSFVAVAADNDEHITAKICLSDFMSCSKCALCSGTCGKGKHDVKIAKH